MQKLKKLADHPAVLIAAGLLAVAGILLDTLWLSVVGVVLLAAAFWINKKVVL